MTWPAHLTVATIVEKNGRFLLVYENDEGRKVYNQPAGHWELNETLEEAAVRETLEETGWQVEITALMGIYIHQSHHNGVTYHRVAYVAKPIRQVSEQLDPDIEEAVWLTEEEILQRKEQMRSPMVIQLIQDYRNNQTWPLDLISYVK